MRLNRQGLGYIAQMQAPQTSLQFTPFLAQALASTHPHIAHTHSPTHAPGITLRCSMPFGTVARALVGAATCQGRRLRAHLGNLTWSMAQPFPAARRALPA